MVGTTIVEEAWGLKELVNDRLMHIHITSRIACDFCPARVMKLLRFFFCQRIISVGPN